MQTVRLGKSGPEVSRVGFGTGAIAGGNVPVDRAEALSTLNAALDSGITLIDGGDFYGAGVGELLTAEALRGRRREDVVLSVKYGARLGIDGVWRGHDTSPASTKAAIAYSLTRLGTDYIDIYRPARIEGAPVEDIIGAVGDLIDEGYVRHVALSEVGPETLRRACAVRPIVDVQLEYSLLYRGIESSMLSACRELGVSVTAFAVLSRGLLTPRWLTGRRLPETDARNGNPRFHRDNLSHNVALVGALAQLAGRHEMSVDQLAIAWILARGEDVVPLIGARTSDQLARSTRALTLHLPQEALDEIDALVPLGAASGSRYPDQVLARIDPALR